MRLLRDFPHVSRKDLVSVIMHNATPHFISAMTTQWYCDRPMNMVLEVIL